MKKRFTNDGTKGGNLEGKPHDHKDGTPAGGVKAVVTDKNGQPVELEGGEVIINKAASKKHWRLLSKINQSAGNGVPIGPPVDPHDEDPEEYREGGAVGSGNKIEFNPNHIPNKWVVKYAREIKQNHPEIWKLGGNIFGNEAFVNLERVSRRGYWLDSEEWMYIKWRSYVARHKKDFRIEGVVAMLKWCDKVEKGWSYMKDLIEEKANKAKRSKKGWSSKTKQMRTGGEVKNKSFVVFFKSKLLKNIVYTNVNSDSVENAIEMQKTVYSWAEIQWIKGFETKSGNELQEFFLHNVKQKWETKPELSVAVKNSKIIFKRNNDSAAFYFTPVFEVKDGAKVFKEGYLQHGRTEIYIDSEFNFDRNKIFELMLGKMRDGGEVSKGIKTEMEHKDTIDRFKRKDVSTRSVARSIANDHLKEDPHYYTKLSQLEKHFEKGGYSDEQRSKVAKVMREYHSGDLKTSYGEKVTNEKQAIAIALSEAGVSKKAKKGMAIPENANGGDCYEIAGKCALNNIKKMGQMEEFIGIPHVVHLEVEGQGEIQGIRYGHAVIEDDALVYDFSNGREIILPKYLYYNFGKVITKEPKYFRYTFTEAKRKMLDSGHYGPWDLITESGL